MNLKSSHKIPRYNLSTPLGQSVNIASDQKKSGSSPHFHSRNGDHGTATILICLFDRPCLSRAWDLHPLKASRQRQNMWIDILILELIEFKISDVLSLLLSSELLPGLEIGAWIFYEAIETRTISYHFDSLTSQQTLPFRTISSEPKTALLRLPARRHWCICFKIEKNPLKHLVLVYLRHTEGLP